jgi:hypothetical protein
MSTINDVLGETMIGKLEFQGGYVERWTIKGTGSSWYNMWKGHTHQFWAYHEIGRHKIYSSQVMQPICSQSSSGPRGGIFRLGFWEGVWYSMGTQLNSHQVTHVGKINIPTNCSHSCVFHLTFYRGRTIVEKTGCIRPSQQCCPSYWD